jgi:hypothetical protein
VNWLHNGQPTGAQDSTTTEEGSYAIRGIGQTNDTQLEDVTREPDATWVIPTDNEWYKAAYHKNDGVTGNYWSLPTGADNGISNEIVDPDPGNHATCSGGTFGDWALGPPYYRTEVGAHENSASPYGTFDQGGNVMEFTETAPESDIRRMRGGSWQMACLNVRKSEIDDVMHSSDQFRDLGFRVGNVGLGTVSLPPVGTAGIRFALVGPRLIQSDARFLVELPEAGHVRIDVFDVSGRRVPGGIDLTLHAGASEVSLATVGLVPGVYLARLKAFGKSAIVRFLQLR